MDDKAKQLLGTELASQIEDGQLIGVGTGTTVEAVLNALSVRIKEESLTVRVVPTSYQSAWRCEELGFSVLSPALSAELDWAFDGADEVDEKLRLLKGRGAALLHEKLVAAKAKKFVVVVGEDKIVTRLGEKMAVPVEFIPESVSSVKRGLKELGASELEVRFGVSLERTIPVFTQEGNMIIDATFNQISDDLEGAINNLPGVVENGIFTTHATEVLVGSSKGVRVIRRTSSQ